MSFMVAFRLCRMPIQTEALKAIMLIISTTAPSRLMLSVVPPLPLLIRLELQHLAISLCLPFPSIVLAAFQLFLRLLHHCERITAHQSGALPFYSARIFITPNVLTWSLIKH
jgi:hypothetical protein